MRLFSCLVLLAALATLVVSTGSDSRATTAPLPTVPTVAQVNAPATETGDREEVVELNQWQDTAIKISAPRVTRIRR